MGRKQLSDVLKGIYRFVDLLCLPEERAAVKPYPFTRGVVLHASTEQTETSKGPKPDQTQPQDLSELRTDIEKSQEEVLQTYRRITAESADDWGTITRETHTFFQLSLSLVCAQHDLFVLPTVGPPMVSVTANGTSLAEKLKERRKQLEDEIATINMGCNSARLRTFLEAAQTFFNICDRLFQCQVVVSLLRKQRPQKECAHATYRASHRFRLSVSVQDMISAGANLLVLGEAGSGKTTSLMFYAIELSTKAGSAGDPKSGKQCLFVPLGRLTSEWTSRRMHDGRDVTLDSGIVAYLNAIEIPISLEELRGFLSTEGTVLLLDGIDEAIKHMPGIIEEIAGIAERYKGLQVVTSSRMAGEYVERIPFLAVTLLPFTNNQRQRFFEAWFRTREVGTLRESPETYVQRLHDHLQNNRELARVARSPLLATVLCVLAEHDVPLPESENRLYAERMRLATGALDAHRGTPNRLTCRPDELLAVSRAAAFELHLQGRRDEYLEVLVGSAVERLRGRVSHERCRRAIAELVDPCMVCSDVRRGPVWIWAPKVSGVWQQKRFPEIERSVSVN